MDEHTPLVPEPLPEDGDTHLTQPNEDLPKAEKTAEELLQEAVEGIKQPAPRWYATGDPAAPERSKPKKERVLLVWTTVATVAFLLCFALLLGVAVLGITGSILANNGLSTALVAESASPATVLISCKNGEASYSYGTGFFLREDGHIATNYHVIEDASEIRVTLYSGKTLAATVVGYHAAADLAVLHISGEGYPVLPIGDSDALRVGDRAIVIGNPAGPDAPWTVTQGIFSYLDRIIPVSDDHWTANVMMLQTDAAVNHGNSGGPICNSHGEVVGIITRKMIDNESIGFAIPINGAMEILGAILDGKKAGDVDSSIVTVKPLIGISVVEVHEGESYSANGGTMVVPKDGVLVQTVNPDGVAYRKLFTRDIIIAFDGVSATSMNAFSDLMENKRPGDVVRLTVIRNGLEMEVSIHLAAID